MSWQGTRFGCAHFPIADNIRDDKVRGRIEKYHRTPPTVGRGNHGSVNDGDELNALIAGCVRQRRASATRERQSPHDVAGSSAQSSGGLTFSKVIRAGRRGVTLFNCVSASGSGTGKDALPPCWCLGPSPMDWLATIVVAGLR